MPRDIPIASGKAGVLNRSFRIGQGHYSFIEKEVAFEADDVAFPINLRGFHRCGEVGLRLIGRDVGNVTEVLLTASGSSADGGSAGRGKANGVATSPKTIVSKFWPVWLPLSGEYERFTGLN